MAIFEDPNIIFRTIEEDPQNTLLVGMSLLKQSMLAVNQLSDATPVDKYTINNGIIYPKTGYIRVDTEGQSPQDDLEALDIADTHDGMIVHLQAFSSARTVTLKKNSGINGIDIPNDIILPSDQYSWVRLKRNGQNWQQVQEFYQQNIKSVYELCEFYYFRSPILKPGFQVANGGLIQNAATLYPDAWAYLQTSDGAQLCKTETEWQAMTTATWATLSDGTKVGWDGIGGAPFFVVDTVAGTLRLPDIRGMYSEASGYDSMVAGGTHGDAVRNIKGTFSNVHSADPKIGSSSPLFFPTNYTLQNIFKIDVTYNTTTSTVWEFDAKGVIPTAIKNQPRAWGALACVYLGGV